MHRYNQWDLPTVTNLNARSLSIEKTDELQVIADNNNVECICVTETWLKEYISNNIKLQGFSLERKDRINRRGGGLACYM